MYFQAVPHLSCLVTYLTTLEGNMAPAAVKQRIEDLAHADVLANIRESPWSTKTSIAEGCNFTAVGTVNLLAYNN